jgi:hypothetical protein
MLLDFFHRYKRLMGAVAAGLVVAGLCYGAYVAISRVGKVAVSVNILPMSATILANGITLQNGTSYLAPGTYSVSVSSPGFAPMQQDFTISAQQAYIVVSLPPVSAEAKKYRADHPKDYLALEGASGQLSRASGSAFHAANPITARLPYIDKYFSIGYKSPNNSDVVILITTTSPRLRYYALQQIINWGYDPINLNIQFTDFKNPLGN